MSEQATPGWTWHLKVWNPADDKAHGVNFSSGGLDKSLRHFDEAGARAEALRRFSCDPDFYGEAYIKSPDRRAFPVAERGEIWWPRLGAEE